MYHSSLHRVNHITKCSQEKQNITASFGPNCFFLKQIWCWVNVFLLWTQHGQKTAQHGQAVTTQCTGGVVLHPESLTWLIGVSNFRFLSYLRCIFPNPVNESILETPMTNPYITDNWIHISSIMFVTLLHLLQTMVCPGDNVSASQVVGRKSTQE